MNESKESVFHSRCRRPTGMAIRLYGTFETRRAHTGVWYFQKNVIVHCCHSEIPAACSSCCRIPGRFPVTPLDGTLVFTPRAPPIEPSYWWRC
ncbi:hypothetical protein RRG08_036475 [Elysia crispata]|uniref:Uncharacterized protein n=1 Tax=Elysia crispata TaxID=231223 RepID=A0AAE0ZKI8_9GAST|nr:hypothetical protein RRG08_036475 [Elysia crispata]